MVQHAHAVRRVPLSTDRVLRAAVALADASGIESLNMRALALDLGVVPMALYKHVANKEQLLAGMVDLIVGEIQATVNGSDWKSDVRERILAARRALVRHRWRVWFVAAIGLLVFAIGLSRIALGVHFLSDVIGGWLLGLAWISVTAYAFQVWRRETGKPAAPLEEGLEPEAAADLEPAPDEQAILPHPWAKGAAILVGWVFTFGVLYFLGYLVTHHSPGFDDAFPRWLQTFRTPGLDRLSWLWSKAGDTHAILAISLVFCPIALAVWRQWRPVLFLVLAMFGELTLFLATAAATGRPRPAAQHLDGTLPTSSFPSGHIAATICLWTAIALIAMGRIDRWWRWLFLVPVIVMPAGVAVSRMYRGMHHPTDVLGAILLAACWLSVLWWTVRPNAEVTHHAAADLEHPQRRRRSAGRDRHGGQAGVTRPADPSGAARLRPATHRDAG